MLIIERFASRHQQTRYHCNIRSKPSLARGSAPNCNSVDETGKRAPPLRRTPAERSFPARPRRPNSPLDSAVPLERPQELYPVFARISFYIVWHVFDPGLGRRSALLSVVESRRALAAPPYQIKGGDDNSVANCKLSTTN